MTRRILSCRRSRLTMSRGLTFEFEDVIAAADDAAIVEALPVPTSRSLARGAWRARNTVGLLADRRQPTSGDELVFAVAQSGTDIADHLAHRRLIKNAAVSAAYIEELWIRNVAMKADVRRLLDEVDHVFVGCEATVGPLAELIDAPVSYLPPSVDQERFAAEPWPVPVVDVYAMGRRHPDLHAALLRWAAADPQRMYHFDTFTKNPLIVDHVEHRLKLADFIRRSRYFIANEAKVDSQGETGGQSEVGYRFFEGAAAGAIMIGPEVSAPAFERLFGWEDAVVTVDPSGSDIDQVIKELDGDPDRRAAIRRRNARYSMEQHDPAHRWRAVLEVLGLEEPAGVRERIEALAHRAETVDPAGGER